MWPFSHVVGVIAVRGRKAKTQRPLAYTDGAAKPAWGPLTPAGIQKMHQGDLFYFGVGILVWLWTWPSKEEASVWPSLYELPSSWIAQLCLRNLIINIGIYEFWHQLLLGTFSNDSIKMHRYSPGDPYRG